MKGSTRQIPGASFIWSCFVQNRAFILCPLKCDFRPLDIAWQPCVRLPRNIATRSRFYSRRSANTYPSLESDHKNDPYHGKTGQHALTSNKIFFSKSPVFAVHRGIVRHLPAEHKIQSLPVRISPSPKNPILSATNQGGCGPPIGCTPGRQRLKSGKISAVSEGTSQARYINKETQREQISDHERQRAGKSPFFKFTPARRMYEAVKHQKLRKGNF